MQGFKAFNGTSGDTVFIFLLVQMVIHYKWMQNYKEIMEFQSVTNVVFDLGNGQTEESLSDASDNKV